MTAQITDDDELEQEELLRIVRCRTRVLWVGMLGVALAIALATFGFIQSRDNAAAVRALSAEITAIQHASQQQQGQFNRFLNDFITEQNYVCSVAAAYAKQNGLPMPAPTECSVAPPHSASPAPQPQPTPAPAGGSRSGSSPGAPTAPARASASPTVPATPAPTPAPPLVLPSLPPLPALASLLPILAAPDAASQDSAGPAAHGCGLLAKLRIHGRACGQR